MSGEAQVRAQELLEHYDTGWHIPIEDAISALRALSNPCVGGLDMGEGWQSIETAPKDGTRILVQLHNPLPEDGRPDLERWHGIPFVARHNGVADDGFDIGWQFAAPVGQGGFPDRWMAGWRPLPAPPLGKGE